MTGSQQNFRPIEGLGKWVMRLCVLSAIAEISFIVVTIEIIRIWNIVSKGYVATSLDQFVLDTFAMRFGEPTFSGMIGYAAIAFGFAIAISVATLVVSAIWVFRASFNAGIIDPYPDRISPGWAVGWFFVPIANFWMPYRAMVQTWKTSMGAFKNKPVSVPWILKYWWGARVVCLLMFIFSLAFPFENVTLPMSYYWDICSSLFFLIAIYGFYHIVKQVTAAQADGIPAAMERVFE